MCSCCLGVRACALVFNVFVCFLYGVLCDVICVFVCCLCLCVSYVCCVWVWFVSEKCVSMFVRDLLCGVV